MKSDNVLIETLITQGVQSLSDTDLVAVLIGVGLSPTRATAVATAILAQAEGDLTQLTTWQLRDFLQHSGMSTHKAGIIMATIELGRRLQQATTGREVLVIREAADVFSLMQQHLHGRTHEEFWVVLLNNASQVLRTRKVFVGGLQATSIDPKVLFRLALGEPACSRLILVHNHPSGQCLPSALDAHVTERLVAAGKALDLLVLDHVIYTDIDYFSFNEQGLLR